MVNRERRKLETLAGQWERERRGNWKEFGNGVVAWKVKWNSLKGAAKENMKRQ